MPYLLCNTDAMNPRTIRVQGKGIVSQSPDRVRLIFTIVGKDPDFSKAVEQCNLGVEALRTAAEGCSIAQAELKTTQFNVREESDYVSGRHQHVGFQSTHQVGVLLPIDRELLGRFLSAVLRSNARPQVNLAFEVSDPEELKQRVLADAVENAKRRAQTIATASGVALGPILGIEYGYAEVRISSEPCSMKMECAAPNDIAPEFQPDDVEAEDTVTITWEIS